MNRPKIWFLAPSVSSPTGGNNNFYRLCGLAEEMGIEAYVLSETPYDFCDPMYLKKFWRPIEFMHNYTVKYDIPEIQEGDIIVQPEIYNWRSVISKPVRRVTYIQNWSLATVRSWQNHYWTYNNSTNLSYSINNVMRMQDPGPHLLLPTPGAGDMHIDHTRVFIDAPRVEWSLVTPYFDIENFSTGKNDSQKIMMFPRKSAWIAGRFKEEFGDKVLLIDGLQPSEVIDLYREVGIVVLPSPAEGLCFPAIEAMLSGAVVLSWACGAPEEFLIDGETGLLSAFGDVEGMIERARDLLENPEKREYIAKNALELSRRIYTKERAKLELYLAYHRACSIKPE